MSNKCPCTKCICKAICIGKCFSNLMSECQIIANYYYFSRLENFDFRLESIVKSLNPVWENKIKT